MTLDMGVAIRETLAWLDAFADGNGVADPPRRSPVRVWVSGADQWRELPEWPLAAAVPTTYYLRAGGGLGATPPGPGTDGTSFTYDPADPTPSVGGRTMSLRAGGSQDNTALEARRDVLTFSTEPLETPIEIAGAPVVRLHLRSDNPSFDIFARLCDVSPDGRSANVTDQIYRSSPAAATAGDTAHVDIALTDVAHVFAPGHRIRVQISGGAHPRFSRNLGTGEDLIHGTRMATVTHHVQHSTVWQSAVVLPVVPAAPDSDEFLASAEPAVLQSENAGAVSTAEPSPSG
jgi:putative CocE/NonD family hydrolase